jgi:hypothetical protein
MYLKFFAKLEVHLSITPELMDWELFPLSSFDEITKIINKRGPHIATRPLIGHLFLKKYDRIIRKTNSI